MAGRHKPLWHRVLLWTVTVGRSADPFYTIQWMRCWKYQLFSTVFIQHCHYVYLFQLNILHCNDLHSMQVLQSCTNKIEYHSKYIDSTQSDDL